VLVSLDVSIFFSNQWHESLLGQERLKKETLESRLQMLKSQINPHFLFNSLTTLSALIRLDQKAAAVFVRQLSAVYRYVLENREKEVIELDTEFSTLQTYLYLVEIRFTAQIRVNVTPPEQMESFCLPPLALQILIENAIKHNVASKARPLTIDIFPEDDNYLVVQNTLQRRSSREYSSKIGLKNIIARYRFLTDKPVQIEESDGKFVVKIPLLPVNQEV
jgi:LytS/YehU family sensor histidine kinase